MGEPRDVVVGYDGSDFSMQALEWAMDEAELRKLPLSVAHAWRWPYGEADEEAKLHLRKAAEHVLYHGADCARSCSTITEVTTDLYEGAAAERLVELSGRAELIVVGSRGMGALARTVVGSVAGYAAAHARCPVVVVRGPGPIPVPRHRGAVVLGITDDTPDGAIAFAFGEAALRGLELVVVHAGHVRAAAWGTAMPLVPDTEVTAQVAEEDLLQRLKPWRDRNPAMTVRARFVTAPAKEALVELSRRASLTVVGGARGDGKVGSVTRTILQHAAGPVAVVPTLRDTSRAESTFPAASGDRVPGSGEEEVRS
ncbi:universal stress protein [Streptosporangium sp. NPDC051022]|uniref:universal stress protein n=1 Tax=Streptosporangium sp. NPDC051022 TaxID=3155752 RepID=UPI003416FF0C